MGVVEAARYLGISAWNFLGRVERKEIPAPSKIGEHILWDVRSLGEFVDAIAFDDAAEINTCDALFYNDHTR